MKIVIAGLIGLMLSVGARAESEVSGQVRFAGGEPVGGADVMLFDVSDEQLGVVAKTTTDEAGQFVLALTAAGSAQPVRLSLGQSYPNPFNPSTIIPYELAEAARVRLDVFNLLGQRVITLVDDEQTAGSYTARWDARDASGQGVASGVYLYRLTAASTSSADKVMATRRMVLVDGSAGAVLPGGAVGGGGSVAETVDVVEVAEVPVYGLAVEVEGLKTYVDSAFVVGVGPVEVVLDAGRAKLAQGTSVLKIPPITLTVGSSYSYKIESEKIYSGKAYGAKSSNRGTVYASSRPIYVYGTAHSGNPISGGTVNIRGVAPGTATVTIRSPFGDAQTIPVTVVDRPVSITSMDPIGKPESDTVKVDIEGKTYSFEVAWTGYKNNNAIYLVSELSVGAYIAISGLLKDAEIVIEKSEVELVRMIGGSLVEEGAGYLFQLSSYISPILFAKLAVEVVILVSDILDVILAGEKRSSKATLLGELASDGWIIPGNQYVPVLMVKDKDDEKDVNGDFEVDLRLKITKEITIDSEQVKIKSTEMIDFGQFTVPEWTGHHIKPLHTILTFEEGAGRVLDKVTLRMESDLYDQDVTYKVRKQGAAALTVESVEAIYPADPSLGSGQFDLSATLSNRSETVALSALGPLPLSYYCSSDPTIDPSDDLLLSEISLESLSLSPMGTTQKTVSLSTDELHPCYSSERFYYGAFINVSGEYSTYSSKELDVPLTSNESIEFVWIEPGTFQMGTDSFLGVGDEAPMHEVSISSGFWLGKYEVTQGQWEAVMGTKPWQENGQDKDYVWSHPSHPAVYISWDDVQEFIKKLNSEAGEDLYRLPTEAEWEYACRAGKQTTWSFGDDKDELGHYAWYGGNACSGRYYSRCYYGRAVGMKGRNPWGLYDMYGNVWEWVLDWYNDDYYDRSPSKDPLGPIKTKCSGIFGREVECRYRGIRGGSFRYGPGYQEMPSGIPNKNGFDGYYMRSADRGRHRPSGRHPEIGFRLVREEPVADDPPDMVVDTLTLLPAVVDTLTSLPAVIETHTPVTVQVRVANEGNGRARQVLVVLRVNGRVVDSIALDFDAGHQTGVEFDPQVLGVGSHSIEVEVDPDGNLTSETVRGNNLVSQTLTLTPQLAAARSVVFILDLSGSMDNAAGDGGTRLEAAKAALAQVLAQAPRDGSQEYALTTFSGCGGVEVPIGFTGDAQTVVSYSSGLVANGGTPLAAALRRAQHLALDEASRSSDDVLLVLLSDGEETCDGDPVGVARLIGQGVRAKVVASLGTQAKAIKVNAIGFGVEPGSAADQQIQAIAKEAGGNYFRASEAADLAVALGQALVQTGVPTLSGRVTDEDGNPIQGALVQLRNMQENTDANGRYLFPARVQGVDSLIVTAAGYARFEAEVYLFDVDKEFDVRLTRGGGGGRVGEEQVFSLPGGGEMAFVWIGPGVFQMGSPESEEGRDSNEGPLHEVEISRGFWLGKYEITQGEWEAVMGDNPSNYKGDARPVERVSWYDVHEFIGRLNDAAGDSLYRLPSEAEWEYACRAGTSTRWSFGNDESQLTGYAWYNGNTKPWSTRAVGQKLPNPWGLYDMYGNVWEWVQDWYDSDYYNSPPRVDPPGPNTGSGRVRRGGYFRNRAWDLRSAERAYSSPGVSTGYIGVRLLRISIP